MELKLVIFCVKLNFNNNSLYCMHKNIKVARIIDY